MHKNKIFSFKDSLLCRAVAVADLCLHTTQEKIFEAEIAGFEDNNLENLFTEYFIFKHVTFICANGLICKNNFSMAQLKDYLLSILS